MNSISISYESDKHDRLSVSLLDNKLPIKVNASTTLELSIELTGDINIKEVISELFGGHYGMSMYIVESFPKRVREIYNEFRNKFHVRSDFLAAVDYMVKQFNDDDFGLIVNAMPSLIINTLMSNLNLELSKFKDNKNTIAIDPTTVLEEYYISFNDFSETEILLDYAEKAILELD